MVISSLAFAHCTKMQHRKVRATISSNRKAVEAIGDLETETFQSTGGRPEVYYKLNNYQAEFVLSILKNTDDAVYIKFGVAKRMKDIQELMSGNFTDNTLVGTSVGAIKYARVVYVLLASDGTVKVGITNDIHRRANTIQTTSGKKIEKAYTTDYCSNAGEIESYIKKKFKDRNILGEWFDIGYEEAVKAVKSAFKEMNIIDYISEDDYAFDEDLIDFISSYTRQLNQKFLSELYGTEAAEKIHDAITLLNHHLLAGKDSKYAAGVFRRMLGIAYELAGLNDASELFSVNTTKGHEVYTYELIIDNGIRAGIQNNMGYKEIYQACKSRCQQAKEIAMIEG